MYHAGCGSVWVERRCLPDLRGRPQISCVIEEKGSAGGSVGGARGRLEKWEGEQEVFSVM